MSRVGLRICDGVMVVMALPYIYIEREKIRS